MTSEKSFWKTLEGKIAAVTAGVVLLTGLVLAIANFKEASVKFITSLGLWTKQAQVTVDANYPNVVPLSLKNTIDTQGRPEWLYWVCLQAENRSRERAHIQVTFNVVRGSATPLVKPILYDVEPRKSLTEWPTPAGDFTNLDDPPQRLELSWMATQGQDVLKSGTSRIELLPRTIIDWDLRTPEGKQAPPAFLLAWLTAWVETAEKETQLYSQRVQSKVDLSGPVENQAREWMKACYNELFAGPKRIVVRRLSQPLPGRGKQTIRKAGLLLHDRSSGPDPLEAALLMAGISRKFLSRAEVDFALFGLPSDQNTGSDNILLLGWRPRGGAWRAVEISPATQLAFAANTERATSRLNALLSANKRLVETLYNEACFVRAESSIAALDLVRAPLKFGIHGLP